MRIFCLSGAGGSNVRQLWTALVEHQHQISPHLQQRARSAEESWRRRLSFEARWLAADADDIAFIAERDSEYIGYAFVRIIDEEFAASWTVARPYAELSALSVHPAERGEGVGRQLMQAVYSELSKRGIADLTIGVIATNTDAIRFYEREGAVPFQTTFLLSRPV